MREKQFLGLMAVLLLEAFHLHNRGVLSSHTLYVIVVSLCVTVLMYGVLNR